MASQPLSHLTPEEFLEMERHADHRSEYYGGEIFPMEDTSPAHGLIVTNLAGELRLYLKKKPYRVFTGALLRILSTDDITYPDLMVVCGQEQFGDKAKDTLLNPALIIEVLSPSTGDFDRGKKFQRYRILPSVRQYVTVAQEEPLIEISTRQEEKRWEFVYYEGLDQTIPLASIGCELSAAEVYDKVEFREMAKAVRP